MENLDEIVGMPVFPTRATTTFADCPTDVDVLFTGAVMPDIFDDEETLAFLADRGAHARWVGAACAGSLLLGGLLRGYRATMNFHHHDLLARFGAIPTRGNVVEDRNRITAGPFTGGVEIALRRARGSPAGGHPRRRMTTADPSDDSEQDGVYLAHLVADPELRTWVTRSALRAVATTR